MTDAKMKEELIDVMAQAMLDNADAVYAAHGEWNKAAFAVEIRNQLAAARLAGWMMVPVEATEAIKWAGCSSAGLGNEINASHFGEVWSAMLAASPMGGEDEA